MHYRLTYSSPQHFLVHEANMILLSQNELESWLKSKSRFPRYTLSLLWNERTRDKEIAETILTVAGLEEDDYQLFWKNYLSYVSNTNVYDFLRSPSAEITDLHWTLTKNKRQFRLWPKEHGNVDRDHVDSCGRYVLAEIEFIPNDISACRDFIKILTENGFVEQDCGTHNEYRKPKT